MRPVPTKPVIIEDLVKFGERAKLVQRERTPNEPYDFGLYELVEDRPDAMESRSEGLEKPTNAARVRLLVWK